MNNWTVSGVDLRMYEEQRIVSLVLNIVICLVMIYLIGALLVYEYRVLKKNSVFNAQRSLIVRDTVADMMRRITFMGCIVGIIRFLLLFPEVVKSDVSSEVCIGLRKTSTSLYGLAVLAIYIVLWLRQRALYRIRSIALATNKFLRLLSRFMIALILVGVVAATSIHLYNNIYEGTSSGCGVFFKSDYFHMASAITFIVFIVLFQVVLLFLLLYPMYIHKSPTASIKQRHVRLMKRLIVTSSLATLVDLFCTLLPEFYLTHSYGTFGQLLYNTNILIALLCIVLSFRDWKSRLFPFTLRPSMVAGTVRRRDTGERPSMNGVRVLPSDSISSSS